MKKAIDKAFKGIEVITCCLLMLTIGIVVIQIISRYVFKSPLSWTEQVDRFIFAWIIMLGVPLMYRAKQMVAFDLLQKKFPPKMQLVIKFLFEILIVFVCYHFAKVAIDLCIATKGRMTSGVKIPFVVIYSAQPVCGVLLIVVAIENTIEYAKALFSGEKLNELKKGESVE